MERDWIPDKWDSEGYGSFLDRLSMLQDEKYRDFQGGLIPNHGDMIGVRNPVLKSIAKEIAKGDYAGFIRKNRHIYYEENFLHGLVISEIPKKQLDLEEFISLIRDFVPYIDNWSVCDTVAMALKLTKNYSLEMHDFICGYLSSDNEYSVRFSYVMLMWHYSDERYFDEVLDYFFNERSDKYYINMAVAWGISRFYCLSPEKTYERLLREGKRIEEGDSILKRDIFTYRKSISKIMDSNSIDAIWKERARSLRSYLH